MPEPFNPDTIRDIIRRTLSERDDIVAVYLFGSLATGHGHALSDIDLAVLFRLDLSVDTLFARALAIGAVLETALPRALDLVVLNSADLALCFQVLKNGRLLLDRDPDARSLFVMRSLGRYYDEKRYIDYHNARLVERLRTEGPGRGYSGDRNALAEARRLSAKLKAAARHSSG